MCSADSVLVGFLASQIVAPLNQTLNNYETTRK